MPRTPTARSVAVAVLVRVAKDGAFAAAALDAELGRNIQLEPRDRGLATELVYGTLRHARWLEERLSKHASHGDRGLQKLDAPVRAALLVAAYQLLVLTRVPAFAAVNEAVTIATTTGGPRVGGFVNAVLRKVSAEPRPTAEELARGALASIPLGNAIVESIGMDAALALLGTGDAPPLGIRVEDAWNREHWLSELRAARPSARFELGAHSPNAILAWGAGRMVDLPGYTEGAWTAQEEGSQLVAQALGAKSGEVVLDACAGRGNKTGVLARTGAFVDAVDLHPKKLERLRIELARVGLSPRETYAVDWSAGTGDVIGPYDRILVDAPCSGTGTLRRRPEIGLKRETTDLSSLTTLQKTIFRRCAGLLKPGGHMVYAVCSVLREEAEDVVAGADELGLVAESSFRLLPSVEGTDGYFVAVFSLPARG